MQTFADSRAYGLRNCFPVLAFSAIMTALGSAPARADLEVSNKPTKNISCTGGACVATAKSAVMNAADLTSLLASQPNVSLDAGPAKDITIKAAFGWVSGNALSLKATEALAVNRPVTVAGKASVTIQSASMVFADKASLTFWDLRSSLTINGHSYTLVGDLTGLWETLGGSNTFTALAKDYDASKDEYRIAIISGGVFEGLGHTISNISTAAEGPSGTGLIYGNSGRVSNIHVENLQATDGGEAAGLLADYNDGTIDHASATGSIQMDSGGNVGGLVGIADGGSTISNSHAKVNLGGYTVGGLVGLNGGNIDSSYAEGSVGVSAMPYQSFVAGGLVGIQAGTQITNSYSTAKVRANYGYYGGLIGYAGNSLSGEPTVIHNSYAGGKIKIRSNSFVGGIIGGDQSQPSAANTYWDLDTGVGDPSRGTGDLPNAPGITGLTDAQLKSGLPAGFDPKVWGQSPGINSGYPYLLANPPPQ